MPGCDAAIWEHEEFPEEHPEVPTINNSTADNFQTLENINNSLFELEPTAFFPGAKKAAREGEELAVNNKKKEAGSRSQGAPGGANTHKDANR